MSEDALTSADIIKVYDVVRIYSEHERLERRVYDVLRICERAGLGSPACVLDNPFDLSLDSFRVSDGAMVLAWKSHYRDDDECDSGTLTMPLTVFVGSEAAIRAFALEAAAALREEQAAEARRTAERWRLDTQARNRAELARLKALLGE